MRLGVHLAAVTIGVEDQPSPLSSRINRDGGDVYHITAEPAHRASVPHTPVSGARPSPSLHAWPLGIDIYVDARTQHPSQDSAPTVQQKVSAPSLVGGYPGMLDHWKVTQQITSVGSPVDRSKMPLSALPTAWLSPLLRLAQRAGLGPAPIGPRPCP